MARVRTPLLSLGATGRLGGAVVASRWKGLNVLKQLVPPSNPRTAAQTAHRAAVAAAVRGWRLYLTADYIREGWNYAARQSGRPRSAYHEAMTAMIPALDADSAAPFMTGRQSYRNQDYSLTVFRMDNGAVPDPGAWYEIYFESDDGAWTFHHTFQLIESAIVGKAVVPFGTAGRIWCTLDDIPRSGPTQIVFDQYYAPAKAAWDNYLTDTGIRDAWDIEATTNADYTGGFEVAHYYLDVGLHVYDPLSFAVAATVYDTDKALFTMQDMQDGTVGTETGQFDIYTGTSPTALTYDSNRPIVTGNITTPSIGTPGQLLYVRLVRNGISRTGIYPFQF